jgi:MFS family permease
MQGFGFGGVIVALYVVIGRAYPEDLRPRVFTALSGAWIVPGIAGPLVAGAITDTWGWRWVFFAIVALLVPVAVVLLPRLQNLHIAPDADAKPTPGRKRLALMAAVGVALVQVAMQRVDVLGLGLGVLGVVLLGASLPQLLPEGTLRLRRGLPTVVMLRGLFAGAFFGAEWFIPLLLVSERGLASSQAGGSLSGAAVGWFVGSWVQGRPNLRASRERMVVIGSVFTTVGLALSTVVTFQAVPWWTVALTWSIGSFGMGILYGSLGVLVLQFSPPAEQGVNSAALQMADSLGVILATGLGGAIFAAGHVVSVASGASGADDAVYRTIFLVMSAIAIVATAISPRVATRSVISAGRR